MKTLIGFIFKKFFVFYTIPSIKQIIFTLSFFLILNISFGQTTETYYYDANHQLEKIIKADSSIITFQYDEVGNRKCMTLSSSVVNRPPIANAGSNQSVNSGVVITLDGSASSDPDGNSLTFKWSAPSGITLSSTSSSKPTFTVPEVSVNTNYTFSLIVSDGTIDSPTAQVVITVNNLPLLAGVITGNTAICRGETETYTVPAIIGATSYIWTIPLGVRGISSINSISLSFGASAVSGNIKVKGHNSGGDGIESTLAITVNDMPSAASTITGNAIAYKGTTETYSVPAISGADSYIWTLPTGVTGTSSSNSITVSMSSTGVSGVIKVKGHNSCGDGTENSLPVSINDILAGVITGNTSVCKGGTETYTVSAISGATSYIWTLPTGATGTSSINSITLSFGTNAVSGNIKVKGHNSGGDGAESTFAIIVNDMPSGASTISGNAILCKGGTETYTVPTITGATFYMWTLPSGLTGTSTSNTISVIIGSTATSGNIKVKGHNSCGDGSESTLAFTVNSYPLAAGVIIGNTNICQETNNIIYSVPAITGATSYIWTLPIGVIGSSNTNVISLTFGNNSATGNLKIKAHNDCGDGIEASLSITVCLGVGIEDATLANKVEIYPNPTHDVFYVTINNPFKNNFKIEVSNSFGQIMQSIAKNKGENKFSVDLTNYPNGLYFVRFYDKVTHFNYKIVKQ